MSEGSGYVSVNAGLVLQTIVEHMVGTIEGRRDDGPPEHVAAVLAADDLAPVGSDAQIDANLRHAGYLARIVEGEMFEPARRPADWIEPMLTERLASGASWEEAVAGACAQLARTEPLGKPSPDDAAAMTWRVPGPGGHVRHFLARRTIEEYLGASNVSAPVVDDPAELKRPWVYGFFVRACEEALPAEGAPGDGE